jgi:uncharacterized damage-inducible protein DinB
MNGALLTLYGHKTWATVRLIEHCAGLAAEHLDATIPGTYGTIRDTVRHLVEAEEDYYWMLTRDRASAPMREGPVAMAELADRIGRLGSRWETVAEDTDLPAHQASADDGWRFPRAVPMAQAIHHADDHRSHVLSILGARGLEVPGLDVWDYADSQGLMREPERGAEAGI